MQLCSYSAEFWKTINKEKHTLIVHKLNSVFTFYIYAINQINFFSSTYPTVHLKFNGPTTQVNSQETSHTELQTRQFCNKGILRFKKSLSGWLFSTWWDNAVWVFKYVFRKYPILEETKGTWKFKKMAPWWKTHAPLGSLAHTELSARSCNHADLTTLFVPYLSLSLYYIYKFL